MVGDLLKHGNVKEVIFIDKGVDDWQSLVDGAPQGAEIVTLDPSRDGLVQMVEWAEGKAGYTTMHILSHGSQGQVQLGTASLNNDTIAGYSEVLTQIGQSLTEDGELMIYGCEVAAEREGRQFIGALTEMTGLKVAAATHKVGHESFGGNWDLDYATGIHTNHFRVDAWQGHLAAPSLINGLGGTAGFGENEFPRNDDGVTSEIDITSVFGEQGLKFGDTFYTGTYINNNGMITFGEGFSGYSPSGISNGIPTQNGYLPLISLFWTDIDTTGGVVTPTVGGTSTGSNLVYWDIDTDINDGDGKKITFTWDDVGLYSNRTTAALAGQIVLYDAGSGNMNIEFRYEYAGSSTAAAGWNVGVSSSAGGRDGIDYYQISTPGDLSWLDTTPGNTGLNGVYRWYLRDGVISGSAGAVSYSVNTFNESADNNGSIGTTISIALEGDTFTGNDNDDFVADSKVTISDVPDGLTAVLTRIGDTTATLTLTGTATSHANANDIENLTVTFADTALTGGNASIINNTVGQTFRVDFIGASNAAPTGLGNLSLAAVDEDTTAPAGAAISSLAGLAFEDGDDGATLSGVAVIANTADATTEGSWQYSTNTGTNWFAIGNVSNAESLALSAATLVRFVPIADYNGTPPELTVRAMDDSANYFSSTGASEARVMLDASNNGGASAISANTNTISTTINPVNDAPTVTSSGTTSYTENDAAAAVNPDLTVVDIDNATLASATVSITGNFQSNEDVLAYTNDGSTMGNIVGSYNNATGELTLISANANATVAEWQTALRAVTYTNTSDAPSTSIRTVSFEVSDDELSSNIGTRNIIVTAINDAPVVANLNGDNPRGAPGIAIALDVGTPVTVTDVDSADFNNGSLTIITFSGTADGNFGLDGTNAKAGTDIASADGVLAAEDKVFVGTTEIGTVSATNDGQGGSILTITFDSSATPALVSTLLQSFNYISSTVGEREFGIVITDGNGGTSATSTVTLTVNTPPDIDGGATVSLNVAENSTSVTTVTATDADSDSLIYSITGGADQAKFNIDESTGVLSFKTAPDFESPTDSDTNNSYIVEVTVDDSNGGTDVQTLTINVTDVNEAPVITSSATGAVEENAATNTVIYTATVTDEDARQTLTFSLAGTDAALLNIDASSGEVTLNTSANFETKASYSFDVIVTDDGNGTLSDTQAVTVSVIDINDLPTGSVTITGNAVEDQTLTASNDLADEDGLGTISYQWLRDGSDITGATGDTYTLAQADVGSKISVRASYTDPQSTEEVVTSAATDAVDNVNDVPTGSVTIAGTAAENETLTASNTLADEDGLGTISYQWLRDGSDINGATGDTYTLTQADVGSNISVRASYTDQQGTDEAVTSAATAAVANVNDAPMGSVTVSGIATEDEILTASNTLADEDGLGTISYQWLRDGSDITGATGDTYTLTQADVGSNISVRASYTDSLGTPEAVTSPATGAVANVNDAPLGSVTITGTVAKDETLTASNTLADEDGLGTISYQWLRDGVEISGATGDTYNLTQVDVGSKISVRVGYTDLQGMAESMTSVATGSVANVNDAPTGSVTITGNAVEDQTLTASNDLADEDGLGTISYQWLRDGVEISGATGETYTLIQADVGSEISVRASYTDQQGTEELIASMTTPLISARPELDDDGVPDEDEARVPSLDGNSTGDGNGDGIPDAEQSNVSSAPFLATPTAVSNPGDATEAFITLSSNGSGAPGGSAATLALRNVRQLDAPDDQPDDLSMPFGLIAFEADVATVGGLNLFSLFVDGDLDVNGYWKQNADGDWVNLASAEFGGSLLRDGNKLRFDFVIEDGGEFDSDGVANGIIVDPGAIGFRAPETSEEPVPQPEPTPEPQPDIDPDELPELNRAPVANNDEFLERFGWLLSGNLFEDNGSGIDKDADNDVISITGIGGQAVVFDTAMVLSSGATVTVQENGDFLYDQRAAFEPSDDKERFRDIFEYSIEDIHGAANTAIATVELVEANDTFEISILHALYEMAFDRQADAPGHDYWSGVREEGVSVSDIAEFFLESEEFVSDHGNSLSDDDYLTMLYANAFDRAPDVDGFEYWSNVLEEPTVDHGDVMAHFALSDEMQIKHLAEGFIFA